MPISAIISAALPLVMTGVQKLMESKASGNGLSSLLSNQSAMRGATGSGLTNAQWLSNGLEMLGSAGQMAFQAHMSNTAYRRAAEDMLKAGLNPALMYGSGSAASSPAGASPQFGSPQADYVGLLGQIANISLLDAQRRSIEADIRNKEADTSVKSASLPKIEAEVKSIYKDIESKDVSMSNISADTAYKEVQTVLSWIDAKYRDEFNRARNDNERASAVRSYASAAFDNYMRTFAQSHGGQMPGYNAALGIASALQDSIGKIVDDPNFDAASLIGSVLKEAFGSKDSDSRSSKSPSGGR